MFIFLLRGKNISNKGIDSSSSHGCFVVCDLANRDSLKGIEEINVSPIPIKFISLKYLYN